MSLDFLPFSALRRFFCYSFMMIFTLRLPSLPRFIGGVCFLILSFIWVAFTPAHADWKSASALSAAVPKASAAEMEGRLYVMSGSLGTGLRRFFELYDIERDGWRPLTPLPTALRRFSLSAGAGRVFVMGGQDSETGAMSSKLWMYAPESAVWFELANMPLARLGHASFVEQNLIYVLGGFGAEAERVQSYNLDTGKWQSFAAKIPAIVSDAAVARMGQDYVLAGGTTETGADSVVVQAFSPATKSWRRLPDLPEASSGGALGVVQGHLHYVGGFSTQRNQVLATHYRLKDGQWQNLATMPQGRHQMAYYGTGDALIVIGGALGRGFYSLFTASDGVSIYRP
jgi:N-acetylneuraminic acid mutarotase